MVLPGLQKEHGVISWKVQASVGTLGLLYHTASTPQCVRKPNYTNKFPLFL